MRKLLFSMLVAGGLAFAGSPAANAAPANGLALSGAGQNDTLTLVRDGCGRGRHFSKWRGICVWSRSEAPAYRGYRRAYPYYAAPYGYYGYGPGYYGYGPGYYRPGFYFGW